jgi:signal transduction histidine kinase
MYALADSHHMDPRTPELHAFGFRAILEVAEGMLGVAQLNELIVELGLTRAELEDPTAWFSADFAEALIGRISEHGGDPSWLARAMRLGVSPRYLGPLYPLVHAFGTPGFAYRQVAAQAGRFTKVVAFSIAEIRPGYARIEARAAKGARRETTTVMCECRAAQLAMAPVIFDLPPAQMNHPKCMARGDEACVYEVRWRERAPRLWSRLFLLGGLLSATALFWTGVFAGSTDAALALVLVIGAWAIGRTRELSQELGDRVHELTEHSDALTRTTRANEDRYAELLQAKSEVDLKVEQRTSELREATSRLSDTLEQIQELDRAKTDFFNNVSHELRSPLTLILAPLEELVAGRTPPGGDEAAFRAMHRSATRLLRLINQLLDLAKIDAGEMKIAPAPTDLSALGRSILGAFESAAKSKGVALHFGTPLSMPQVVIDPSWIESALTNLLANALRLTPSGGSVRLTIEDHGSEVLLSVADSGPGIAPADHKKVFERFGQSDATKRVGGTGIGLALVREAARLHGGDVKLDSDVGRGATFTLMLPRRQAPIVPVQPTDALAVSERPAAQIVTELVELRRVSERPGPGSNAPVALVVEDNPELREFIGNVLAVRYRVRTAHDGKQGLVIARELRPDVIVSDVAMPNMDGYQLTRALRATAETRATPILLVTARTEVTSVLEGFDAGADDYIAKPFPGRELLARVDVHVRLRRLMRDFALRERHATLGVLAASVAHQVRNPLTTIVSGLPAMRTRLGSTIGESTLQLMDVMIDCAQRIERLTVDLMDLSRVDREESGTYRPSDGLRAAIRLVRARLPASITIEEEIADAPLIDGRAGDMNHVFLNVLDNAARAVEPSGTIRVEGVNGDGVYVIRVGDSGPGVDDATAKHIFEPFFTTRPAGEGTGLGLAVAQQVLLQCGGQIELGRSDLGGALFTVHIPSVVRASVEVPAHPTLH